MQAKPMTLSPEEYLALEREAEFRHEYVDGEIIAMSGGSMEHSLIAANLIGELRTALRQHPCQVFTADMRIKAGTRYTYPDLSVVCGQSKLEDEHRDTLLNPVVVCEVLSDSTAHYDRGDKFAHYQEIASLRHYILVSQKEVRVEHFLREGHDAWTRQVLGPGHALVMAELECEISIDEIYLKVFDSPASA